MNNRSQTGFTLYELLTTMLIVGVILALGVPNMRAFNQNSRISSIANDLHSSFHLARSEATRAKANVTICASANFDAVVPVCGGEFESGWIIFEDRGVAPGFTPNLVVDAGEPILRRFPPTTEGISIATPGPNDFFTFGPNGTGRGNVGGQVPVATMVVCDSRGNEIAAGGRSAARALIVTPLGRATVLHEKAQVAFHGGCP
jgi:type IV fimbrial biogenesis protein FimT